MKSYFAKLVTKAKAFIATATIVRNNLLNRMVDRLVNIEPLTDKQNKYALYAGVGFFMLAVVINFAL